MYELHEHEQYFFDTPTLEHLAKFVGGFTQPCCLCAPLLGRALVERGVSTTILDTDDRFGSVAGFQHYDLYRPAPLRQTFGLIVCDPPFFKVSLSQLFGAVRLLSQFDYTQPLLICYLSRRAANITGHIQSLQPRAHRLLPPLSDSAKQRTQRNRVLQQSGRSRS
jgi:hypothetical protein